MAPASLLTIWPPQIQVPFLYPYSLYVSDFIKTLLTKISTTAHSILFRSLGNFRTWKLTCYFSSLSHWNTSWLLRVRKTPLLSPFQRLRLTTVLREPPRMLGKHGGSTHAWEIWQLHAFFTCSLGPFRDQLLEFRPPPTPRTSSADKVLLCIFCVPSRKWRGSCVQGWLQTSYKAKDGLEFLNTRIKGEHHWTWIVRF